MRPAQSSVRYQNVSLWEYLLVAHPDELTNQKVAEEKNFFHNRYDHIHAIKSHPHITIANFLAKEVMEETLIRWIQNICRLQTSFTVTLNNFSGFPPHTIYLRVQDSKPFKQLTNALKIIDGFIQSNDCPPLHLVTRPHVTIARSLPEHIYEKAIEEYAGRSFTSSFRVEKLILLKREGEFGKCEIINTFTFSQALSLFD